MLGWFKDWMLKRRCAEARKTPGSEFRNTLNYHQVNQIGILFHLSGEADPEPLARFIRKLEADHKKLKILTYFEHPHSHPYRFYIDYFLKSDISLTGEIRSPKITQFLDTQFDFLFCIETEPQPVFDVVLSRSKANCRIGLYNPERTGLFEMMVQNPDWNDLDHTVDQMLAYTKSLIYNA
jgi:hypothetical protein